MDYESKSDSSSPKAESLPKSPKPFRKKKLVTFAIAAGASAFATFF